MPHNAPPPKPNEPLIAPYQTPNYKFDNELAAQAIEKREKLPKVEVYDIKRLPSKIASVRITSCVDSYEFAKKLYGDDLEVYESVFIVLLNRKHDVMGYAKISQGGTYASIIDRLIIGYYVVSSLADNFILVHNHPTGSVQPSDSDIALTKEVKEVGKVLGSKFIDHIIISGKGYYSFAAETSILL